MSLVDHVSRDREKTPRGLRGGGGGVGGAPGAAAAITVGRGREYKFLPCSVTVMIMGIAKYSHRRYVGASPLLTGPMKVVTWPTTVTHVEREASFSDFPGEKLLQAECTCKLRLVTDSQQNAANQLFN